ncbi:MAG TPA: hypothetical protein VFY84_13920 [Jiangellales bacterium]|nr:hypothetical protein [Jiangellales bacterium]
MTEKTNPATPRKHSDAGRKHALRTRISGVRSRIHRVHVIAAGIFIAVLAVGGAAWAVAGGAGSPEAAGTEPAPGDSASPATAGSFPVPTWTASESGPGGRGRGGGRQGSGEDQQQPGMPSDLSAERDGDTVVLQWTDNTNNEDGFTIFVAQGWTSFQINVPAGTTRYDVTAEQDTRTCFAVVPFSWTGPVGSDPTGEWECTGRERD